MRRNGRGARCAALVAALVLAGCAGPEPAPADGPEPVGAAWPAADGLFRQEARWLGSDAAYSIPLGGDRTLWLFGDTFIATSPAHRRDESVMVSNTVAIQQGHDPTTATMRSFWRETDPPVPRADLLPREAGLGPRPFLADADGIRHWPAHGVAADGALLVFWMKVAPSDEGLGFAVVGTRATLLETRGDDPLDWSLRDVELGAPPGVLVGTMGAAAHDGWLYALSTNEPQHQAFVVRFPLSQALAGDLGAAWWWTATGWSQTQPPIPLFDDGAPEGSLHHDAVRGEWLSVQTTGFGGADLDVRTAPSPEGPWSARRTFFRPPESDRPNTFVYAGKAHPQLLADGLALTYAQNADDFDRLVRDDSIYWPRFVRLTWE